MGEGTETRDSADFADGEKGLGGKDVGILQKVEWQSNRVPSTAPRKGAPGCALILAQCNPYLTNRIIKQ